MKNKNTGSFEMETIGQRNTYNGTIKLLSGATVPIDGVNDLRIADGFIAAIKTDPNGKEDEEIIMVSVHQCMKIECKVHHEPVTIMKDSNWTKMDRFDRGLGF